MIIRTTLIRARALSIQSSTPLVGQRRAFTCAAWRQYPAKSADEVMEEIQELYATAKDEFEIASDETAKKTIYAADDRAAAKEELMKLKEAFTKATAEGDGEVGKEVGRRVGGRIRELEKAVEAMEERAMED